MIEDIERLGVDYAAEVAPASIRSQAIRARRRAIKKIAEAAHPEILQEVLELVRPDGIPIDDAVTLATAVMTILQSSLVGAPSAGDADGGLVYRSVDGVYEFPPSTPDDGLVLMPLAYVWRRVMAQITTEGVTLLQLEWTATRCALKAILIMRDAFGFSIGDAIAKIAGEDEELADAAREYFRGAMGRAWSAQILACPASYSPLRGGPLERLASAADGLRDRRDLLAEEVAAVDDLVVRDTIRPALEKRARALQVRPAPKQPPARPTAERLSKAGAVTGAAAGPVTLSLALPRRLRDLCACEALTPREAAAVMRWHDDYRLGYADPGLTGVYDPDRIDGGGGRRSWVDRCSPKAEARRRAEEALCALAPAARRLYMHVIDGGALGDAPMDELGDHLRPGGSRRRQVAHEAFVGAARAVATAYMAAQPGGRLTS